MPILMCSVCPARIGKNTRDPFCRLNGRVDIINVIVAKRLLLIVNPTAAGRQIQPVGAGAIRHSRGFVMMAPSLIPNGDEGMEVGYLAETHGNWNKRTKLHRHLVLAGEEFPGVRFDIEHGQERGIDVERNREEWLLLREKATQPQGFREEPGKP